MPSLIDDLKEVAIGIEKIKIDISKMFTTDEPIEMLFSKPT
jgi:hypothetical protein